MAKQLNVGLVGYKFMGKAHSSAYARLPMFFPTDTEVKMKAICGRDEEWVKQSAQQFGFEDYELDYHDLCKRDDIDIVDCTAPSDYHKKVIMEAIANGKHVFCEKPLAITLPDAREMLAAAEKAGVKHQIGFNFRFAPAVQLAKQMIDEGRLGKIFHFRGMYLQDYIIDPRYPMSWRLNKDICGSGSLGDLGAHVIDMARFLVGDLKTVTGMNRTFVTKRPIVERMEGLSAKAADDAPLADVTVDDATCFVAEFENGALGTFEATRFAQGNKNAMSFEINGEKGSIRFYWERLNELQFYDATQDPGLQGFNVIQASEGIHPYCSHWWPAGHVLGYDATFVHELYEFTQAIANDTKAKPGFEDGVAVAQVLDAVDLSIARKAWVDVNTI
ncbi:MAG: Gfo/Idh/MocA family oxidoreductase [Eubacteriales bacterium]|nr:Gfo/Idh/MocA family oxidoreductase [Eubacteriales bacterium]